MWCGRQWGSSTRGSVGEVRGIVVVWFKFCSSHTWEMVLVIMVVTVRVVVMQWEGCLLSWSGTCDL